MTQLGTCGGHVISIYGMQCPAYYERRLVTDSNYRACLPNVAQPGESTKPYGAK